MSEPNLYELPPDLPVPVDDGTADHLAGSRLPDVALPATDGRKVRLDREGSPWLIVYAYPKTGRPGEPELTPDWDQIPGARGCTPESCGFRDHRGARRTRRRGVRARHDDDRGPAGSRGAARPAFPAAVGRRSAADTGAEPP